MTAFCATFTPEAWVNDYAIEVDPEGPTDWDVTAHVQANPDYWAGMVREEVSWGAHDDAWVDGGVTDRDDVLKSDPNAPEWVRAWRGPFTIRVRRVTT